MVAEFAELEDHMDTPVKRFSTGELARVVDAGSGRVVEQTDAGASWTWSEVLEAGAGRLVLDGAWDTEGPEE